jgi:rhamnulokinase
MHDRQVLAFDLGASSGRAILGRFDGHSIKLEELHRFANDPVQAGETLYWDVLRQLHEIKQGLVKTKACGKIDSLSIDTWGVDFGLIDQKGYLLENPVHYRDRRTKGVMEAVFQIVPTGELYRRTGIQMIYFNTINQLYSLQIKRPELLERADRMLLMPDLFLFLLTGQQFSERTITSTGQLLDPTGSAWNSDLIFRLGFPERIFCPLIDAGTVTRPLSGSICREIAIPPIQTIAVASHDTASAVAAVPAESDDFIYISSGTWSLMGIESPAALINAQTFQFNFTNESGFGRTVRTLKNIMGLWLIQESRRQWIREGEQVTYADLEQEALSSDPFRSLIDPDDESLAFPGDMPGRIRELCRSTGQPVPMSRGEVMRCVYESLALKYRVTKDQIESITGHRYLVLHVVGGGTKDGLLSQFTADATGCQVIAGPIEATAFGNIAVQLIAQGVIGSLQDARRIIARSDRTISYQPQNEDAWQNALDQYRILYPVLK